MIPLNTQCITPVQASDITGGIYIKTPEPAGLLQFLIVSIFSHDTNLTVYVYCDSWLSISSVC